MFRWEEILDYIAKALNPDAESVQRALGAVTQGAAVQGIGFGPALQSKMLEEGAAQPDRCRTCGKSPAPLAPLFAVEFFESCFNFVLLLQFAVAEDFQESVRGLDDEAWQRAVDCNRRGIRFKRIRIGHNIVTAVLNSALC